MTKNCNPLASKKVAQIAICDLWITDLDEDASHELSAASISAALHAAYEAGRQDGTDATRHATCRAAGVGL